ncbi:MAG: hypothetical protein NXH95_14345 [Pseudomonadaceae bacterium]|nr:hypothetical protein [Pseudomonadaceae bacterium]
MKTLMANLFLLLNMASIDALAEDATNSCIVGKIGEEFDKTCLSTDDLLGKLDLTVPSNPLFTLFGSSPETVIKPAPGEKITASFLPDLFDALGNEQQAFAIEIRPALFMAPDKFTRSELFGESVDGLEGSAERAQKWARTKRWSPLTTHIAATESDDESSRIGVGFSYVRDSADPLFSSAFGDCLSNITRDDDVIRKAAELVAGDPSLDPAEALEQASAMFPSPDAEIESCVKSSSPWNRTIWSVGGAAYRTDTDSTSALTDTESGYGFWASYARPLGSSGQLLFHLRYSEDLLADREIEDETITLPVDTTTVAMRYTQSLSGDGVDAPLGSNVIRAFFEAGYFEEELEMVDDEYFQAGLGFEFRVRRDLYFQLVFGDTFGSDLDRDLYLNGQVKWSFSSIPLN